MTNNGTVLLVNEIKIKIKHNANYLSHKNFVKFYYPWFLLFGRFLLVYKKGYQFTAYLW